MNLKQKLAKAKASERRLSNAKQKPTGGFKMNEAVSPEAWAEASATRSLNLVEMDQLVKENQELWADSDAKKKVYLEAYHLAEEADKKLLQLLTEAGKTKYFVDGIGEIYKIQKTNVPVPASIEDRKVFFEYLKTEIGEDFFLSKVNISSQGLNSWYNEKLEEAAQRGELLKIPGLQDPTMRESIGFRKARKA